MHKTSKKVLDLSGLEWTLTGSTPFLEFFENPSLLGELPTIDTGPVKARVPGSVQMSLFDAGLLPDWNIGDNIRSCEWVENRHWIYRTTLPDEWFTAAPGTPTPLYTLCCDGLDYSGWIYVNGAMTARFEGTHIPVRVDISAALRDSDNELSILFDLSPRWLGQFGYTSQMTKWKTRFNYTWDWIPRFVQIGVWDAISIERTTGAVLSDFRCAPDADPESGAGLLWIQSLVCGTGVTGISCKLLRGGEIAATKSISAAQVESGFMWDIPGVEMWWPNLLGPQKLYTLRCELLDGDQVLDVIERRVGFRHIEWRHCDNARANANGAEPWICAVNGKPIFLRGFNFQPIRPNYADLTAEDYRVRLDIYRDIGTNFLRINACGFLEFEYFYDMCDEMGIMVWQEFPLTSSGVENWPPEDKLAIFEVSEIAASFIRRRQHHASLIAWGGGNELQGDLAGEKTGIGKPCDMSHPMLRSLGNVVRRFDPSRRYIPTSPYGPRAGADPAYFGEGLHHDVHGPDLNKMGDEIAYWENDDATFRSEIYAPGANSVVHILKYAGDLPEWPPVVSNPLWRRPTPWWIDWEYLCGKHGREPENLEEYVEWSQQNQAERLRYAVQMCMRRFPAIGGVLLWGSHETFPLPINVTVIDFDANPKPAAYALKELWTKDAVCE